MVKYLVVVESPGKISSVSKYLNNNPNDKNTYIVKATGGHIMNLNSKKLSIDLDNHFEPEYQWLEDAFHKKVMKEIKDAFKECQGVYIASDCDLEGENIGYSICRLLNVPFETTPRLRFHKITKKALQDALKNPAFLDPSTLDAQKTRRVTDRLIGYLISPVTRKIKMGLSVGRVQSVAVKLVVEREKEINKFQAVRQFRVEGIFDTLEVEEGKPETKNIFTTLDTIFPNKEETLGFLKDCQIAEYKIGDYKKKLELRQPGIPFISATLQTECCRKFNISAKKVMDIAQKLYEKGLISYPRTDSPKLPEEMMEEIKKYITEKYGEEYYQSRVFKSTDSSAQEAHSCIYPTQINTDSIHSEDGLESKIYQIIHRRTVASQMAACKIRATEILIDISNREKEKFKGRAEEMVFEGWKKIYQYQNHEDMKEDGAKDAEEESAKMKNNNFKDLSLNNTLQYRSMTAREGFTNPKSRYDPASLVTAMKNLKIGRPSTYPNIMETIETRQYVVKESRKGTKQSLMTLEMKAPEEVDGEHEMKESSKQHMAGAVKNKYFPTDVGLALNEFIDVNFDNVFNYKFTAELEKDMDEIESGKLVWHEVVKKCYDSFLPKVEELNKTLPAFGAAGKSLDDKRLVGKMADGRSAYAYVTKFGPAVQLLTDEEINKVTAGEKVKGQFVKLGTANLIDNITVEDIVKLMNLPKKIGEIDEKPVIVKKGPHGIYISYDESNYNCPKKLLEDSSDESSADSTESSDKSGNKNVKESTSIVEEDVGKLSWDKVQVYLEEEKQKKKDKNIKTIKNGKEEIKVMNGPYGPFFSMKGIFVSVPNTVKPENLTLEICKELYELKKTYKQGTGKKAVVKKSNTSKNKDDEETAVPTKRTYVKKAPVAKKVIKSEGDSDSDDKPIPKKSMFGKK